MIKVGIGNNIIPKHARIVHPHPYPIALNISPPKRGKTAPTRDRKRTPAAIADAAYVVNASMK